MLKDIKYNQPYKVIMRKSVYNQEFQLLHDFQSGDKRNMRLEYSNKREAINAAAALKRYAQQARQPLDLSQRGNFVFVKRKESADNAES